MLTFASTTVSLNVNYDDDDDDNWKYSYPILQGTIALNVLDIQSFIDICKRLEMNTN